jgi:hypothetical protein
MEASKVALADILPFQPQFVDVGRVDDGGLHRHTHQNQQGPETEETLNGVWVSLRASSAPTGSVNTTLSTTMTGNLKLP